MNNIKRFTNVNKAETIIAQKDTMTQTMTSPNHNVRKSEDCGSEEENENIMLKRASENLNKLTNTWDLFKGNDPETNIPRFKSSGEYRAACFHGLESFSRYLSTISSCILFRTYTRKGAW